MKRLLLIILLTIPSSIALSQSAYYDALRLKELLDSGTIPVYNSVEGCDDNQKACEAYSILKKYISDDITDYKKAFEHLDKNPLLESYVVAPTSNSSNKDLKSSAFASKALESAGGLNATTIADGIAKFLVARAKEELNITFFERFKKIFKKYPEFKVIFPNTSKALTVVESYNYSAYLNALKSAFKKDVRSLQKTLPEIESLKESDCEDAACKLRVKNYQEFFKTDKSRLLKMFLVLIEELQNGSNPAQILNVIANNEDFKAIDSTKYTNIKNSIYFANLISTSLVSSEEDKVWVTKSQLEKLLKSPEALKIYIGLLYQQNLELKIKWVKSDNNAIELKTLLEKLAANTSQIEALLRRVIEEASNINSAVQTVKTARFKSTNSDPAVYYALQAGVTSLIETSSDLSYFNIKLNFNDEFKKFISYAKVAGGIYNDLSTHNYSAAVFNTRIFLSDIGIGNSEFYNKFLKYASFMAAVAEAENSDQVQKAIEAIALPAGSARIKRETQWNISLNAYLGGFTGTETLDGLANNKDGRVSGINAPIGIAFSKGLRCGKTELGSITAFLSIVDLGAITAYRFENDSTANLPEVKLQNIFAPGIHGIYGLPKLPISIGYGYQLGPALREINSTNIEVDPEPTKRHAFFIAVDIPLINFYTKSR